ncbi:hypothetical protein TH1_06145 [Thalassospira lucentensis MCCC 1A00383 = DSM 14000]|nr:hypothetical protein TH1_06145 [Thalassospira lucentensis MCCC 1A00383 = DSM 14000]
MAPADCDTSHLYLISKSSDCPFIWSVIRRQTNFGIESVQVKKEFNFGIYFATANGEGPALSGRLRFR